MVMAEKSEVQRARPLAPCKLPRGALLGSGGGEGLGSPADTPLSPTEMLSDSEEEDRVSSTTTSYDYRESRALCPAGLGVPGLVGGGEVLGPRNRAENLPLHLG